MSQFTPTFAPLTHLGNIPVHEFLRDYWQQKPLLVKNAFPDLENLISPEELAGLSLEEDVRSRIIIQEHQEEHHFKVEHGPIDEALYSQLPEKLWTLLVQNCDSLDPRVNTLLNAFRFLPNWRLDDIMISYATDGGGVGPHFDYYDVILLQAQGKRRWRIGQNCSSASALVPDQEMKILQDFQTIEEYTVEPGDLLYIPAKVAHWGEAIGECMTYSVGFRAPSHSDFILDYAQEVASQFTEDQRYRDVNLHKNKHPGEITDNNLAYFQNLMRDLSEDKQRIAHWLAEYSTRQEHTNDDASHETFYETVDLLILRSNQACRLSQQHRVCYFKGDELSNVYINGQLWQCTPALAQALSTYQCFQYSQFSESDQNILEALTHQSLIECVTED
ncbi:MAG: cupin domain-containing protein [Agarilytica sp.]